MEQFKSPDVPAVLCYLIVLLVGAIAARASVNKLLAEIPGHWRDPLTWSLCGAFTALPVVLFWFLDYTSVILDTSLFAALIVAAGYQQIFAGGVQGILMPGQTTRLWQPFEAWAGRAADRIAAGEKQSRDELDERLRTTLASDARLLQGLEVLTYEYLTDQGVVALKQSLAQLESKERLPVVTEEQYIGLRNRERSRILLGALRAARPETYGNLLLQSQLITNSFYDWWFGNARARKIGWPVFGIAIGALVVMGVLAFKSESLSTQYHQWRFTKVNTSSADKHRSYLYFSEWLRSPKTEPIRAMGILDPLVGSIVFKEVSPNVADNVLWLIVQSHSRSLDAVAVPLLIKALQTENPDVRLRINAALKCLRDVSYAQSKLPEELDAWVPAKDDSAGLIAKRIREWQEWWQQQTSPKPEGSEPNAGAG